MLSLSLKKITKPKLLPHVFPLHVLVSSNVGDDHYFSFVLIIIYKFQNSSYVPSFHYFDFSTQWHHAMCSRGPHLELNLTEPVFDTWHHVCYSKCIKCPTRRSFPRKTCKFRLSWNSTKIDVVARFRKKIPTVKSVSSSEI